MALNFGCDGRSRGIPEIGNAYSCGRWNDLSNWEIGSMEYVEWDAGHDPILRLPEDPFEQNRGCDITTASIAAGFVRFGANSGYYGVDGDDFLACYCWDEALFHSPGTRLSKGGLRDGYWDEALSALSVYDSQDEVFESVLDMHQLAETSCAGTLMPKGGLPDAYWMETLPALPKAQGEVSESDLDMRRLPQPSCAETPLSKRNIPERHRDDSVPELSIYETQGEVCESVLDLRQLPETSCAGTQVSQGGLPDAYWGKTLSPLPIYGTQGEISKSVLDMRQLPETIHAETRFSNPDYHWVETVSALPVYETQDEVSESVLDMGKMPKTICDETQLSKGGLPDRYRDQILAVLPTYEAEFEGFQTDLDMRQLPETSCDETQWSRGGLPDGYWEETLSALSICEAQSEVSESVLDITQLAETNCPEAQFSKGALPDGYWDGALSAFPVYETQGGHSESVLGMKYLPETWLSKGGLPDGYWDETLSALSICEVQGEVSESVLDMGQLPDIDCAGTNDLGDGLPHEGFAFALGYLGVMDLLSVERVCKLLRSTIRNDSLLWRCIHIDSPLSDKITDDALLQLTQRAQGNLHCLSLINCSRITDEGLRHVLENNPKLRKLSVPECVRLSLDGIISNLKAFQSAGIQGINCLKLGRFFSVSEEQFRELKILLGLGEVERGKARKPLFYHLCRYSSTCDDDFSIDIDICPSCLKYKLVYDCPSYSCQAKGSQQCRACDVCIERCIQCGKCIKDSEYVETFFLDYLCSGCWRNSPSVGQASEEMKT